MMGLRLTQKLRRRLFVYSIFLKEIFHFEETVNFFAFFGTNPCVEP